MIETLWNIRIHPECQHLKANMISDEVTFGESPRYVGGKLYLTDMFGGGGGRVCAVDPKSGKKEILAVVPNQANGLDFLSDGSMLYGSMLDSLLYRYKDGKSEVFLDLSDIVQGYFGDFVIDNQDRLYADDVGAKVFEGEPNRPGRVILVDTKTKKYRPVAEELCFANGAAISTDGKTFTIGESFLMAGHGACLTRFDIKPNGNLANRRVLLNSFDFSKCGVPGDYVGNPFIDGIFPDSENGIWLAMFAGECYVRVSAEGMVTHMVEIPGEATACCLGGPEGKTLFMLSNALPESPEDEAWSTSDRSLSREKKAKSTCTIYTCEVDVPASLTARPIWRP
jgi:sugar lactone lactonase YvrE